MEKYIKEPEHHLISFEGYSECIKMGVLNENTIQIVAIIKNNQKVSSDIKMAKPGHLIAYIDIIGERTKPRKKKTKKRKLNTGFYEHN